MEIKKLISVIALFVFGVVTLTGCTVRTYSQIKDRVDQELTGNRGYIKGSAPAETAQRKSQRTIQVVEVEFGKRKKSAEVTRVSIPQEEVAMRGISVPEEGFEMESVTVPSATIEKYKVKKGDTLQKISKSFYGTTKKWARIYDANRDKLSAPDKIYPGQVLDIPVEGLKEPKENLK